MDKFDREIFDFLTEPEHFNQMLKVQKHFWMVRHNLLEEFWKLVLVKVQEKIGDQSEKWHAKRNYKVDARWSSLWLVKEDWRKDVKGESMPLAISWESLCQDVHYGVWIKNDSKVWDPVRMREQGFKIAKQHKMDTDKHYWPVKYYPKEYDFNHHQNLKHILPTVREETASEFANILWDIATTFEAELDKMYQMRKK